MIIHASSPLTGEIFYPPEANMPTLHQDVGV